MGVQAIQGGYDTARVSTVDQQYRDQQRAAAYGNLTVVWRDETAAALGLNPRKATVR